MLNSSPNTLFRAPQPHFPLGKSRTPFKIQMIFQQLFYAAVQYPTTSINCAHETLLTAAIQVNLFVKHSQLCRQSKAPGMPFAFTRRTQFQPTLNAPPTFRPVAKVRRTLGRKVK